MHPASGAPRCVASVHPVSCASRCVASELHSWDPLLGHSESALPTMGPQWEMVGESVVSADTGARNPGVQPGLREKCHMSRT